MDHTSKPSDISQSVNKKELTHITRELYERNVELIVSNRTLQIQKKIYEIINEVDELAETAQRLIETITHELGFNLGMICLIQQNQGILHSIAVTELKKSEHAVSPAAKEVLATYELKLSNKSNIAVIAANTRRRQTTDKLHEILVPHTDKETATDIQTELGIVAATVYPLTFGKELLGVLIFGMDKHYKELSHQEHESLKGIVDAVAIAIEQSGSYTALKDATHRLRKANSRLKELDALKDEFVSIASHELRTPMTAIKSYLWMALNKSPEPLKDPMQKYLEISYASTERLIHLVNDMLTVSRIERKKVELKFEKVDLRDIVQLVYDELKVSADEKHIHFEIVATKDLYAFVNVDKIKIREVFQNLVGNALKFTPPQGKILIHIRNTSNEVEVAVQDTGPGIPEDAMPKLFQKFSKIDYSYANHVNQPGTGLGLYISKQIVSLHGGKIAVESTVHVGTTFTVTLPIYKEKGGV